MSRTSFLRMRTRGRSSTSKPVLSSQTSSISGTCKSTYGLSSEYPVEGQGMEKLTPIDLWTTMSVVFSKLWIRKA